MESRSLLKQSTIVAVSRFSGIILSVVGTGIVSRSLTRECFGMYAFLSSFAFVAGFFNLGLGSELQNRLIVIEHSSKQPDDDQRSTFFAAFYILLTLCVTVGALLSLASLAIDPRLFVKTDDVTLLSMAKWLVAVFVLAQFLAQAFGIASSAMYSFGHINYNSGLQMAMMACLVVGLAIASRIGAGLVGLALINALYIVVNSVVVLFVLKRLKHWPFPRIGLQRIKTLASSLLEKSVLFWVLGISALIGNQSSVFMVSISSNLGSAGDFSFFQKMFASLAMLHVSALMPLWPKFCSFKEQGRFVEMQKLLHKAIALSLLYYAIGIGFIVGFGGAFVNLWSGRTVHYDMFTIICLSCWALFYGWGNIFSVFLNGVGRIRNQTILAVGATMLFFPLSFYLGKSYGPAGIPLASATLAIFPVIILPMEVKRFFKIHIA